MEWKYSIKASTTEEAMHYYGKSDATIVP